MTKEKVIRNLDYKDVSIIFTLGIYELYTLCR